MNTTNVNQKNRLIGFDILRSLAILIVLYSHGMIILNQKIKNVPKLNFIDGVDLFFVLSGFLIGKIILKTFTTDKINLKKIWGFWLRRWFRTIPNYILAILTSLVIAYIFTKTFGEFNWKYIFFMQNLYYEHPGFLPQAWSLSVEECFYFIFPILLIFISILFKLKIHLNYLLSATILILFPIIIRLKDIQLYPTILPTEVIDSLFRKKVFLRFDSIGLGLLGAYLNEKHPRSWRSSRYALLFLSVILYITNHFIIEKSNFTNCVISFTFDSIAILFTFPFFYFISIKIKWVKKSILILSTISYSMYLFHFDLILWPIIELIKINSLRVCILTYLLYWLLTFGISYLIFIFFETKMTKIRDAKFFQKYY